MNRPPRPVTYSRPRSIAIVPHKDKMQKPEWRVFIDGRVATTNTWEVAWRFVMDMANRGRMPDEQLRVELENRVIDVLAHPWNWYRRGNIFINKNDKHEWVYADEVDMLSYLLHREDENGYR